MTAISFVLIGIAVAAAVTGVAVPMLCGQRVPVTHDPANPRRGKLDHRVVLGARRAHGPPGAAILYAICASVSAFVFLMLMSFAVLSAL